MGELNQSSFSREQVSVRMIRRAAELWGYRESEIDELDPLVKLLIEGCSVEFERLAGEVAGVQNRMLSRLAHLLHPGSIGSQPAHGLMQVRCVESSLVLFPEAQFIHRLRDPDRRRNDRVTDLYFSPVRSSRIWGGAVRYMATCRGISEVKEGLQKIPLVSGSIRSGEYVHSLWLGIELPEEVVNLDGMTFFFQWINQVERALWYDALPFSRWRMGDHPLNHIAGIPDVEEKGDAATMFGQASDPMCRLEQEVMDLYSRHYITLSSNRPLHDTGRQRVPPVLERFFPKEDLRVLKVPLYWIEIQFPTLMTPAAIDTVICGLNILPVLNRRLNKLTHKMGQALNIVPLETEGTFLSVKEVTNGKKETIKLTPFRDGGELERDTYTLRYGINRFDERDAYQMLTGLSSLIREESAYFSAVGQDFLTHHIRELGQLLARLQGRISLQDKRAAPYPYLMIRSQSEGELIAVEFWSSHGEAANRIPAGTRLSAYRTGEVVPDSLFLITATSGGKEPFSDAEKIDRYKQSLLTHDRIVTSGDVRSFIAAELSNTTRSVQLGKKWVKGHGLGQGFIQCMQIRIQPLPGIFTPEEWADRLRILQFRLEHRSANNIPYRIELIPE